jgi:hypothetical protein
VEYSFGCLGFRFFLAYEFVSLGFQATPEMVINVRFCTEKRFSDYIVRELSMTVKTSKRGVEQVIVKKIMNEPKVDS